MDIKFHICKPISCILREEVISYGFNISDCKRIY